MSRGPVWQRLLALGTVVVVGTADARQLPAAVEAVRAELDACDAACSRFRADSELSVLNDRARTDAVRHHRVSAWLCEALTAALDAAVATDGLVDPTVGQCLVELGYDRSFELLDPTRPFPVLASYVPAWRKVTVDGRNRLVSVPAGARLDLGATAKALCADRAARQAHMACGGGVLVSLGGDIALAGEVPADGWAVRVTDRADTAPDADVPGQTVAIRAGGLATSGTAARRWTRAGHALHHVIDPRTGRPADSPWRTVSVTATTCLEANVASTAAIILGAPAPAWLEARRLDARLVTPAGAVTRVGGWPVEREEVSV